MALWEDEREIVPPSTIDVVFSITGRHIPFDHAHALWQEILRVLPWLADEKNVGVHPIRGWVTEHGLILLSQRATLGIRLPRNRAQDLQALSGHTLDLGGHPLTVGKAKAREIAPHNAIHAYYVHTGHTEEADFAADIRQALKERDIPCKMVCGKSHVLKSGDSDLMCYSLALYDLTDQQSLDLQETGLGLHHELGCGVFVPHKSFTAVGS